MNSLDFVEPYLRTIFNFVGITNLHFINAQPMDISQATRRTAILKSMEDAREMVRSNDWVEHEAIESIEFPEGVKPALLEE